MVRGSLASACLLALVCVSQSGCRDFSEVPGANVLLEIVGGPPAPAPPFCVAESPVFWLAKGVDGSDRPIFGVVRATATGSATGPNGTCLFRSGPGAVLQAGRYRVVATDGNWTAVCSEVLQLFLSPAGDAVHRIRFTVGEPGCEATIEL